MNVVPKSGFPRCLDGDVCIVVSTSKIYQLHSNVLRRLSPYFRQFLDSQPPAKLTAAARRSRYAAWRFHLCPRLFDESLQFLPIPLNDSGNVQQHPYPPRGPNIGVGGEDLDACWEWLFGCFYGIAPTFDDSTFGATVQDCIKLVDAAKSIGSLEQVQEVVDLALMRQDEVLWKSVASNPIEWAKFGYSVQSPAIFKEAAIHIIGKWKLESTESKALLPESVYDLCLSKWNDLELQKRATEIRIAGHYPAYLCRNHVDKPIRSGYAADLYMWMAISYFRQYIAQAGNDEKTRLADDGGYDYYRKLSIGGNAYLHHEDLKTFHDYFPMSIRACGILEAHMSVLKDDVKDFVKDLVMVRTHADPATLGVDKPWLTCAIIGKEDLPWHVYDEPNPTDENEAVMNDDVDAWVTAVPDQRCTRKTKAASRA